MLRVLLIDDDTRKVQVITRALLDVAGVDLSMITDVRTAAAAKRLLRDEQFDLVVLDIVLPETAECDPDPRGGLKLMAELDSRSRTYRMPHHIMAMTAYEDRLYEFSAAWADQWSLILFDFTSDSWKDALQRKVRYILLVKAHADKIPLYNYDVCVITALPHELEAVLQLNWSWHQELEPNDEVQYHHGSYSSAHGTRSVVAAQCPRMGIAAAAVLAEKMIQTFRPRLLAMVGIAAGLRGKCELGDIVAVDPSWDWGSGKWHAVDGVPGFAPDPHQIQLHSNIRGKLTALARNTAAFAAIRKQWGAAAPGTELRLHIGPVASGAAVLALGDLSAQIEKHHRKIVGIEMEVYGVYVAATEASLPQPEFLALKSISDFADEEKSGHVQNYAAYTAAQALGIFAREHY